MDLLTNTSQFSCNVSYTPSPALARSLVPQLFCPAQGLDTGDVCQICAPCDSVRAELQTLGIISSVCLWLTLRLFRFEKCWCRIKKLLAKAGVAQREVADVNSLAYKSGTEPTKSTLGVSPRRGSR